jgi:dTDP-4-dehydrorhamnose reductase
MASVLITGVAGFIGHHTAIKYLRLGVNVIGVDVAAFGGASPVRPLAASHPSSAPASSLHRLRSARFAHVQTELQKARAAGAEVSFEFVCADVSDTDAVLSIFQRHQPSLVVHLAARAGVRASIEEPHAFARCNLVGFVNMLDACVKHGVNHFVYASSSSVYGNRAGPCDESMPVNLPISPYAATKAANELLAHSYAARGTRRAGPRRRAQQRGGPELGGARALGARGCFHSEKLVPQRGDDVVENQLEVARLQSQGYRLVAPISQSAGSSRLKAHRSTAPRLESVLQRPLLSPSRTLVTLQPSKERALSRRRQRAECRAGSFMGWHERTSNAFIASKAWW